MLDYALWLILLFPYLALVGGLLYLRAEPVLSHARGLTPMFAFKHVVSRLVHDDEEHEAIAFDRIAWFLLLVIGGGAWVMWWMPNGVLNAHVPLSFDFIAPCLGFVAATEIIRTQAQDAAKSWKAHNHDTIDFRFLRETKYPGLLHHLFCANCRGSWRVVLLVVLLFSSVADTVESRWPSSEKVEKEVAYASVNHHAEVARDTSKIYNVRLSELTPTLCNRVMEQFGDAFAEEGAKNPYHGQYYAKCAVLTRNKIQK